MKSITLCADDYGQNTAISQAIIALLTEKKLSATSCMTTSTQWLAHAAWLIRLKEDADIGIHFNLTEGKPLSTDFISTYGESFPQLSILLKKSYLRQLDQAVIEAEFNAQLDQFAAGIRRLPDFIDGHQHIHQFPVIRDAVLKVYHERLGNPCYVRCVYDPKTWFRLTENAYIKQCIIQLCGAKRFKQLLVLNHIPHNTSFSGIYDFANASDYANFFPRFLQQSQDKGLIMCHPGLANANEKDEIVESRPHEYAYFQSEAFAKACRENNITITRFNTNFT